MFCSHFGAAFAEIFNKCKKMSPPKFFWKLWIFLPSSAQWRIQKILVGGDLKPKPQKFRCLHQSWEWFFGRYRKFKRFFRPKSGGLQKKKKKVFTKLESDFSAEIGISNVFFAQNQVVSKKKKVFTRIETDFAAGFVTFKSVGGDASRNGAELFKIEADFSAKIVTFRLVGGMHPPIPPPKSATGSARNLVPKSISDAGWKIPSWKDYCIIRSGNWVKYSLVRRVVNCTKDLD